MTPKDEKQTKSFTLRLPLDFYKKVKDKAKASRMTLTEFIIAALEDAKVEQTTEERLNKIEERIANIESRLWRLEIGEIHFVSPNNSKKIMADRRTDASTKLFGLFKAFSEDFQRIFDDEGYPTEVEKNECVGTK